MFCDICINSKYIKNSARRKDISALKKHTNVCGVSSYTAFLKKGTGLLVIGQELKKLCQNGVYIHQCAFTV